jgi:hypothetical protein
MMLLRVKWFILSLGRCPRCMRQCFIAAFVSWITAAAAWLFFGLSTITELIGVIALAPAWLWVSHIAVLASRTVAHTRRAALDNPVVDSSRRAFIPTFARVFLGITLATALPVRLARATGAECPATSGTYCDDKAPYCCYSPTQNLYYCRVDVNHCDL